MPQWFEEERFWTATYPFLFSRERWAAAAKEVGALLSLAPHNGRAVLDLCCGPGRHAIALARRGFSVTAVDRSDSLLARGRARARRAGVEVEWVHGDMREFVRKRSFDLAISLFNSIGYFDDEQDDLRVLRNLRSSLKPGGALVLELAGKECIARDYQSSVAHRSPDGELLVERRSVVDDWTRIRNEWTVVGAAGVEEFAFHVRLFSGRELRDRLADAGFPRVRLYGDLAGAPYDRDARRLVALALRVS